MSLKPYRREKLGDKIERLAAEAAKAAPKKEPTKGRDKSKKKK